MLPHWFMPCGSIQKRKCNPNWIRYTEGNEATDGGVTMEDDPAAAAGVGLYMYCEPSGDISTNATGTFDGALMSATK